MPVVQVGTSFPGASFVDTSSATSPPDTASAVGPNVIVEVVDSAIEITDKSGNQLMPPEELSTFFASVFGPGDTLTNPCVVYDDVAQRFYVGALEQRFSPSGDEFTLFDFAASNSANPMQASDWTVFRKVTSVADSGGAYVDFMQMGWNADAVFVSFNTSDLNSVYASESDLLLAIDKNSILTPGFGVNPALTTYQTLVNTGSEQQFIMPARMHGGPANLEYLVQSPDDGKTVNVISETNYLTAEPILTTTSISVNPYEDSPGIYELTDTIDDRILSADWVNNQLVASENVGLSDGLNHARWLEFDTSGTAPVLVQEGDISAGTDVNTSFPSIAVNASGAIAMTYIQSASDSAGDVTLAPSMVVAGWTPGDALGIMEPGQLVEAGVAGAAAGYGGGSYSATEFDPTDQSFWSAQEYTADDISTDDWGTYIANYTIASSPLIYSAGPAVKEDAPGFTLTVNGAQFTNAAMVEWNGSPLTTQFVSDDELTATVPASLLTASGTIALTVVDPSQPAGHTTSNTFDYTIDDTPVKPGKGLALGRVQAGAAFNGTVANFSDVYLNDPLSKFAADVDWDDGSTDSSGTITSTGSGKYQVTAQHTFDAPGTYDITVTITANGINPVTVTDTLRVFGSVLTGTGNTITATAGDSFKGTIASFSDSYPDYAASAYAARINWGDGKHSTAGLIELLTYDEFAVIGKHTYARSGVYTIVITVHRNTSAHVVLDGTADVSAATSTDAVLEVHTTAGPAPNRPAAASVSYSSNWSGYAVQTSAGAVSAVTGSWTVPTTNGPNPGYSATWVGIDGFTSSSVEQIGTASDYPSDLDGKPDYYAWYEMYPNASVTINQAIEPGDQITASVSYARGAFTLRIDDLAWANPYAITIPVAAQRSSAEWVVEAPSSFGVLPLADFGSVTFTNAKATINKRFGAIDALTGGQVKQIDMLSGTLEDQASTLNAAGTGFTVSFESTGTDGDVFGDVANGGLVPNHALSSAFISAPTTAGATIMLAQPATTAAATATPGNALVAIPTTPAAAPATFSVPARGHSSTAPVQTLALSPGDMVGPFDTSLDSLIGRRDTKSPMVESA